MTQSDWDRWMERERRWICAIFSLFTFFSARSLSRLSRCCCSSYRTINMNKFDFSSSSWSLNHKNCFQLSEIEERYRCRLMGWMGIGIELKCNRAEQIFPFIELKAESILHLKYWGKSTNSFFFAWWKKWEQFCACVIRLNIGNNDDTFFCVCNDKTLSKLAMHSN